MHYLSQLFIVFIQSLTYGFSDVCFRQSSTIFSRLAGDDGRVDVGELEYYITLRTHQLHVAFALSDRDGANFAAEYIMQLSDKSVHSVLVLVDSIE